MTSFIKFFYLTSLSYDFESWATKSGIIRHLNICKYENLQNHKIVSGQQTDHNLHMDTVLLNNQSICSFFHKEQNSAIEQCRNLYQALKIFKYFKEYHHLRIDHS